MFWASFMINILTIFNVWKFLQTVMLTIFNQIDKHYNKATSL